MTKWIFVLMLSAFATSAFADETISLNAIWGMQICDDDMQTPPNENVNPCVQQIIVPDESKVDIELKGDDSFLYGESATKYSTSDLFFRADFKSYKGGNPATYRLHVTIETSDGSQVINSNVAGQIEADAISNFNLVVLYGDGVKVGSKTYIPSLAISPVSKK